MGWFSEKQWKTKDELVHYLEDLFPKENDLKIIASEVVNYNHWYVYEVKGTQNRAIGLNLLSNDSELGDDGAWSYNDMDENCGPMEVNCPLAFLDMATEPASEFAARWRKRVRRHHIPAEEKIAFEKGMDVKWMSKYYTLIDEGDNDEGWYAEPFGDDFMLLMTWDMLDESEVVDIEIVDMTPPSDDEIFH